MKTKSKILIIDDQYGRCGLGDAFKKAVSPDIMEAYRADRQNLCLNYGILDLSGDSDAIPEEAAQCVAQFCPAQRWAQREQRIENDLEVALDGVAGGWPFPDGTRWALVLLDLAFVQGTLDVFGDPQERTFFGRDVILPALKQRFGDDLPIVVLSSTPREEHNETIRRAGALDFIQRIPNSSTHGGASREVLAEMLFLHGLIPDHSGRVAGHSLAVLKMLRQARRAAKHAKTILLHGEVGTGKNLLARYIHMVSQRHDGPFEVFNAANRSADLQADELFGHWKGAFTGATSDSPGIWERSSGGTVLIDEVADIDLAVQRKLMDPIEERQVARMGSPGVDTVNKTPVDVLTILATNRDLSELSREGAVQKDFLSRIHAVVIKVPPLRERKEDIPELIARLSADLKSQVTLLPDAIHVLCEADWKDDNVRGLRRTLEQLSVTHPGQVVTERDIPLSSFVPSSKAAEPSTNILGAAGAVSYLPKGFLSALGKMPDQYRRDECRRMFNDLDGAFPVFLAHALAWSLQLCGNMTQAARFLSGNQEMDTSAAKQFIKKILKLDVKQQKVLKAFAEMPESGMTSVDEIVKELKND